LEIRNLSIVQKTRDLVLDILFPISCLSCGCDDVWLCDKCLENLQTFSFQVCPKCERFIIDSGKICQTCKRATFKNKDFFLDALIVSAKYKENNLSRLVHFYKYNLIQDLRVPLGRIMTKAFLDNDLPLPDAIVPIPLHKHRLRWRGFNQSELLANYISENLTPGMEIPVFKDILIRKKYTTPQMKVRKYAERRTNIQGAFEFNYKVCHPELEFSLPAGRQGSNVIPAPAFARINSSGIQSLKLDSGSEAGMTMSNLLKNKEILLIDDIATTGATLNECAKVLKQNGAKKVFGIVLARQEISKKFVT